MRICIIFNPSARGEKARRFRNHLHEIGTAGELKSTSCPGDARRLAAEAVLEGFDVVVAAGGDGTVNEVLNGIVNTPGGVERTTLGILPLGTVNVFARELRLPTSFESAWDVILNGIRSKIDVPCAEFRTPTTTETRHFVQLAGAGLDARAIELVNWSLKKRVGPLAYVWAGLQALAEKQPSFQVAVPGHQPIDAALVLVGNGRLYGGPYRIFPQADLVDGLLEIAVFPKVDWLTLAHCGPHLLLTNGLPASAVKMLRGPTVTLSGSPDVALELDGEWVGHLPATFSIHPSRLQVLLPAK